MFYLLVLLIFFKNNAFKVKINFRHQNKKY